MLLAIPLQLLAVALLHYLQNRKAVAASLRRDLHQMGLEGHWLLI
jgi:hypothetical protein